MNAHLMAVTLANAGWNGAPVVLNQNQGVSMPQTPNGSLVIGYFNRATVNNAGRLALTSGGGSPLILDVPALQRMISILVKNWGGNNLNITNTSITANTPIFVEAFGPGIPGVQPVPLVPGTPVQLAVAQSAQGTTPPSWMQLTYSSNTANVETLALVGGPQDASGNNAYVVSINSPAGDTGPGTGVAPPAGYFATRAGNYYEYQFNWGAATVYVANLSSQTALPVTVLLQSL